MTCIILEPLFYFLGDGTDIAIIEVAHGAQRNRNGKVGVEGLGGAKRFGKVDPVAQQAIEIKVILGFAAYPDDFEFLDGKV